MVVHSLKRSLLSLPGTMRVAIVSLVPLMLSTSPTAKRRDKAPPLAACLQIAVTPSVVLATKAIWLPSPMTG